MPKSGVGAIDYDGKTSQSFDPQTHSSAAMQSIFYFCCTTFGYGYQPKLYLQVLEKYQDWAVLSTGLRQLNEPDGA
jgi:hypothetical protein